MTSNYVLVIQITGLVAIQTTTASEYRLCLDNTCILHFLLQDARSHSADLSRCYVLCRFFPCPPPACPSDGKLFCSFMRIGRHLARSSHASQYNCTLIHLQNNNDAISVNECGQVRDPFSDPPCEFPGCASPCPLPANIYSVLRRHKWNQVCVPWGDTPFASDTSTSSASTFVGTASGRSDRDFDDGGYLETASTIVVSTTGEPNDADMINQYDMAIDWARSDDTPNPTGAPTSSPTPGPTPGPNPSASLITSDGMTSAAGNMIRYGGGSPYQYYTSGYQPKTQMANAGGGTYIRLRRRRHRRKPY